MKRYAMAFPVFVACGLLLLWSALPGPARAAGNTLPEAVQSIPAGFNFVFSVDVKNLLASPLYRKLGKERSDSLMARYRSIFDETALAPERDIERLTGAAHADDDDREYSLMIIAGTFNREAITSALLRRGATEKEHGAFRILTVHEAATGDRVKARLDEKSIVFLSDREAVAGDLVALENLLEVRARKKPGIMTDAKMAALLGGVNTGDMLWFAGDAATAIKNSPIKSPLEQPGLNVSTFLTAISGSMNFTDALSGTITAEAVNAPAAENLMKTALVMQDVVRASGDKNAGVKMLARGFTLSRAAERITVRLDYPSTFFEQLLSAPASPPDTSMPDK